MYQPLDPRSPWVVGIHELMRRPGEMKTFRSEMPAPAGVGIGMIWVPEGSPIDVDVRLESVSEGVLATGTVSAGLVGECARCLTEVTDERDFELQDLYYYPGRRGGRPVHRRRAHRPEQPMRDDVLELPFIPLCREDRPGLCPEVSSSTTTSTTPTRRRSIPAGPRCWSSRPGRPHLSHCFVTLRRLVR